MPIVVKSYQMSAVKLKNFLTSLVNAFAVSADGRNCQLCLVMARVFLAWRGHLNCYQVNTQRQAYGRVAIRKTVRGRMCCC